MLGRTDKTKVMEEQKELGFRERIDARIALCHDSQASLPRWTADLEPLQLPQKDFDFHGQVKCPG